MAEVSQRRGLPPHFIVQQREFANRASSATWDDDPDESQEHSHKHLGEAPSNHMAQSSYRDHAANDKNSDPQPTTNGTHATSNGAPKPAPAPAYGGGGWGPMAVRKTVFEHHDPNDTGPTIPEHMLSARAKKSKKGKGRDQDPEPLQTLSTKPVEPKMSFYASEAQTTDQDPKVEPEAWRRAIEAPGGRDEATIELLAEYGASVEPQPQEEDNSHLPLLLRLEPLNPPEDPNRVVPVRLTAFDRRELKAQLDEDIDDYWQNAPSLPPAPAIAQPIQEKKPEASIPTPAPTTAAAVNATPAAVAAPSAVSKSFSRLEAILEKARQTRSAMAYTMASH